MAYANFQEDLIERTLAIARDYAGPHDASLLLNCLFGLVIVPKERFIEKVPTEIDLLAWGIQPGSVKAFGARWDSTRQSKKPNGPTVRAVVRGLRHSVAHFGVSPYPDHGEVQGFTFRNDEGFHARLSLEELRAFTEKLAAALRPAPPAA